MHKLTRALLWVAYPLLIYGGLHFLQPRYVALLLCVALLIRKKNSLRQILGNLGRPERAILLGLLSLTVSAAALDSETLLRLYPAAVNIGVFILFALSLKRTPTMIERFARLEDPNLSQAGVRYTRDLTVVWCVFLVCNGIIAFYTALWTSRETWALYNGLLAYVLMGILFAGERLLRRHLIARYV